MYEAWPYYLFFAHAAALFKNNASIVFFNILHPSPGIFAYLNYHVPRTRREILEILIKGLQRLEYRGYDSAGERAGGHSHQ